MSLGLPNGPILQTVEVGKSGVTSIILHDSDPTLAFFSIGKLVVATAYHWGVPDGN